MQILFTHKGLIQKVKEGVFINRLSLTPKVRHILHLDYALITPYGGL